MQGRSGKGLEQAQGAMGLGRTEGQEQVPVEAGGGQAEARKAVTESVLLWTSCPATPDQALPGTLAASPFLSAMKRLQMFPGGRRESVLCTFRDLPGSSDPINL